MSLLDEFIDDLYAAIREAEYSPSEFAFDEQEADDPAGSGQYSVRSYITITRTSTGTSNRYHAGRGLDFPTPFISDLYQGFFGDP